MGNSVKSNVYLVLSQGWDRMFLNMETQVYLPAWWEFAIVAPTGVLGFLSELVTTFELGKGGGTLLMPLFFTQTHQQITPQTATNAIINPSTLRETICDSENYREAGEMDLKLRPRGEGCTKIFTGAHNQVVSRTKLEYVHCPLTHYWENGKCVKYGPENYKPLVSLHEHFLLGTARNCFNSSCEQKFDSDTTPIYKYSALRNDASHMTFPHPMTEPVSSSFLYSLEYMGVRDGNLENPFISGYATQGPLSIISHETCESFGLSTIYALDDPINEHVKKFVEHLIVDGSIDIIGITITSIDKTSKVTIQLNDDEIEKIQNMTSHTPDMKPIFKTKSIVSGKNKLKLEDRVREADPKSYRYPYLAHTIRPYKHNSIPYGVTIVPYSNMQENNELYIVHKERGYYGISYENVYGIPVGYSPPCTSEYKCICFKGNEYTYMLLQHWKEHWEDALKDDEYVYTLQPVHTLEECVVAFSTQYGNHGFQDLTYYDNIWNPNEAARVVTVRDISLFGCKHNELNVPVFNDQPYALVKDLVKVTPRSLQYNSMVKVIRSKVKRHVDDLNKTPRVLVKTPTEFIKLEERNTRILNVPGLFAYDSGQATFPREAGFTPIKYRYDDISLPTNYAQSQNIFEGPDHVFFHEINGADVKTFRHMRDGESYSYSNKGIIETIQNFGTCNTETLGEQEHNYLYFDNAGSFTGTIPQVLESVPNGVENIGMFPDGSYLEKPKPMFADIDNDGTDELIYANKHLLNGTRVFSKDPLSDDFIPLQKTSIPFYELSNSIDKDWNQVTPHFADVDGDGDNDLILALEFSTDLRIIAWFEFLGDNSTYNPGTTTYGMGDGRFHDINATSVVLAGDYYYFGAENKQVVCRTYAQPNRTDTSCPWLVGKTGNVAAFDGSVAIYGDTLQVYDGTVWNEYTVSGYPAYYDGGVVVGHDTKVEYVNLQGNPVTNVETTDTVTLDHIDIFFEGQLTGGAVNITMPIVPCRALAIVDGDTSFYMTESNSIDIPSYNLSFPLTADNVEHRVCGELPNTPVQHAKNCVPSHSFPSQCPEGWGLVHAVFDVNSKTYTFTDGNNGINFLRDSLPQCVLCPEGKTSPDGHARCLGDEYLLGNTSVFIDEHAPFEFATHLQEYHHNQGDAYHPVVRLFNGMKFVDNEMYSDTKFLVCDPGYVPEKKFDAIPTVTNLQEVLDAYEGTCSGYTCQRCPDSFKEDHQRCVPCPPGHVSGWAYNEQTQTTTHDHNTCIEIPSPVGHYQDVQNRQGVTVDGTHYPYVTHCDHWVYHPEGNKAAYQDEANQLACKIATAGKRTNAEDRVTVEAHQPGQLVSNDRTRALNCSDHQVCDGEQIIGCAPNYIWYRQTDDREDEECVLCNQDNVILNLHAEKEDYEYCSGSHMFECADASYTNAVVNEDDTVGSRPTWSGSNLVYYTPQPSNTTLNGQNNLYILDESWHISRARRLERLTHSGADGADPWFVRAVATVGDTVISGGSPDVRIWNRNTGEYVTAEGHTLRINSIAVSPDGTKFASASDDGSVKMWNLDGTLIWSATHHTNKILNNGNVWGADVYTVDISPDGSKVVSGGVDKTLRFYNAETGDLLKTFTENEEVYAVAWADDTTVYSGGNVGDSTLSVWDYTIETKQNVGNVEEKVHSIDVHEHKLAIATRQHVYAGTQTLLTAIESTNRPNIVGTPPDARVVFSPDGEKLVTAGYWLSLRVYETENWVLQTTLGKDNGINTAYGHVLPVHIRAVAWGDVIVSGGEDKTIRMWSPQDFPNTVGARVTTHVRLELVAAHLHERCFPVPDNYYALDKKWKLHDCGYARHMCTHRTFHQVYPYMRPTNTAPKYMFTRAVRETSYDEIFRFSSRQCTDGHLQDGCLKEYCAVNGQTNCWCGEEEDFCTMACVDGMCLPSCGEQVCDPDYEMCYGVGDGAECARKCSGPVDNYCVTGYVRELTGTSFVRLCRHYNDAWNSTSMQSLDPKPSGPCFDEVPNIPETQCRDIFDQRCFCARTFLDDKRMACKDKKIVEVCSVPQNDGSCTYVESSTCLCGTEMTSDTCYQVDGKCGAHATTVLDCTDVLSNVKNSRTTSINAKCRPTGAEEMVQSDRCKHATKIEKVFEGAIGYLKEKFKCVGDETSKESGCIDPYATNYNRYAVVPKKCIY